MASGVLDLPGLQRLIDTVRDRGYRVVGPRVRDGAITLGNIETLDDLPRGVGDAQGPGSYRLTERTGTGPEDELFGFAAPVQSGKSVLFPPDELLWRGRHTADGGLQVDREVTPGEPIAVLGLRGCDLAAIRIQDRVLLGRAFEDAHYAARREQVLLIAVTCGTPAATCFCTSMGTGPKPGEGADLTLTELTEPHRFLVEAGSEAGTELMAALGCPPAVEADLAAARAVVDAAVAGMGRSMRTDDLPDVLRSRAESARWADIATRCLACSNCTSVCPTCFCTTVEDVSDLTGQTDERHRVWDSCFSMEYSWIHGGAVRTSTAARYRQFLTHKLASWNDQFGSSGCVGCGRCITWCPAGIDLTVEVAALRELAEALDAVAAGVAAGTLGTTPRTGSS